MQTHQTNRFLHKQRFQILEERIKKLESNKQSGWDKFKVFVPIISSVLVSLIGIWATNSITSTIEKQRLELSHLTAMSELISKMSDPNAKIEDAEAIGVFLGSFGFRAVSPLIHELGKPGQVSPLAAREGIRAAAFKDPLETCDMLVRVLENKRGLFSWEAHLEVIKFLGEIGCDEAKEILLEYKQLLQTTEGRRKYLTFVRTESPPTDKALDIILEQLNQTLNKMER